MLVISFYNIYKVYPVQVTSLGFRVLFDIQHIIYLVWRYHLILSVSYFILSESHLILDLFYVIF